MNIAHVNILDGIRLTFDTGEVLHFRRSGNAPEFRIYAIADTEARAEWLREAGLRIAHEFMLEAYDGLLWALGRL